MFLPCWYLLAQLVGHLFTNQPQSLCSIFRGYSIGTRGHFLQRLDGANLLEEVCLALLFLDLSLHAEVECSEVSSLFTLRQEDRYETLEPVDALAVAVCGRCQGEFGRGVRLNEGLDQF